VRPFSLDELRTFAVTRSLFGPVSLQRAIDRLGFVQADPIRAPARAQDLTLRHRVRGYRAGDLERRYASLAVEEDVVVNYGFVSRAVYDLMHPRDLGRLRSRAARREQLLDFVRERGEVHPRQVDAHFLHGTVVNYWGGSSSATTHLLEDMHYRGLLRVTRREQGIRLYAVRPAPVHADDRRPADRVDALADVVVAKYAPLTATGLSTLIARLRYAVPQWRRDIKAAVTRAKGRLAQARVDGIDWFWPQGERPSRREADAVVRLLAPFDPVVWDRRRFELLWGWPYRFEAYTPASKRKHGYYALPMLWRDHVIGWANLSVVNGALQVETGYVDGSPPRDAAFTRELDAEVTRMRDFLGASPVPRR
jgi:uncharacterized protein